MALNLDQVRLRAKDLQQALSEMLHMLRVAPERLHWEAILKTYASINLQVMALKDTLRGVLRQAVVHPCMVDQPALSQVLPIQLSSAVLPEQLDTERQQLADEQELLSKAGVGRDAWLETTELQVEAFNKLLSSVTGPGGCMHPQSDVRRAMTQRSESINKSMAAMRQGLALGPATTTGAKRSRAAQEGTGGSGFDPALRQLLTGEAPGRGVPPAR